MRFLFITDTHLRGNNPQNRTDQFLEAVKAKLEEVVRLAEEYEVRAILHGGDFFHVPIPSFAVGGELVDIFAKTRIPLYGIAGNHDLYGHNPATLPRTMLGFLARMGVVRLLRPGEKVYFEENGLRVQLTGQEYHYEMDKRDPNLDYVVKKEDADFAIHMVHGMLLDRPHMEGVYHTTVDQIKHTEADFTLCGHNHNGFQDVVIDGKAFLNPGALVRIYNHPYEMRRPIQCILIDFTGGEAKYRKIPLKSAKPGDEVLDRSQVEAAHLREQKLAGFVQAIQAAGKVEFMDYRRIVDEIARREGIDERVKEEALRRIQEAELLFLREDTQ